MQILPGGSHARHANSELSVEGGTARFIVLMWTTAPLNSKFQIDVMTATAWFAPEHLPPEAQADANRVQCRVFFPIPPSHPHVALFAVASMENMHRVVHVENGRSPITHIPERSGITRWRKLN